MEEQGVYMCWCRCYEVVKVEDIKPRETTTARSSCFAMIELVLLYIFSNTRSGEESKKIYNAGKEQIRVYV